MARYLALLAALIGFLAPVQSGAAVPDLDADLQAWLTSPMEIGFAVEIGPDGVPRDALLVLYEKATGNRLAWPVVVRFDGDEQAIGPPRRASGPGRALLALRILTRVAFRQAGRLLGDRFCIGVGG